LNKSIFRGLGQLEMKKLLSFTLLFFLLALTFIGFKPLPVMGQTNYYLKVDFSSANVNGKTLSASDPTITVSPGSRITGYLEVIIDNNRGGSWITPVIGTASWKRGWYASISGDAPTGKSTQKFSFDLTAPSTPGTYYIGIFTGWMYSCDEVASNDHPAKFGDGDDVWDMPSQGWEEVIRNGVASTGPYHLPGRAIRIVVSQTTGNIVIRVHNLPGHNMPGAGVVRVALWYGNYERYVGEKSTSCSGSPSYVSVSFSGLSPGNYVYEVYQTPDSGLRLREFWGSGFAKVEAGTTRYTDFYRHTQWITGFTVNGQAPSKDITVRPGEKVSVRVTIKNEEGTSISAKARVILDRDRQAPYDYDRTSGALTISSKGSVTFSLPEYYPTEPGTYYMYVVAYGLYSDWTVTDQWVWSEAFRVITSTVTLQLRSYSVDGKYSKFRITFDGTTYYTPKDLQVNLGTHRVRAEYPGGELSCYDFHHWEWSGGISVKSQNSRETDVTVNGDGMLKAIYGIRVYLSSETTDGKTNVGTITFDGKTYSLSSFSDPKLLGRYSATANPPSGYRFLRWETRDYISVSDPNSQTTTVRVNGFGVLKAVFTIAKPDLPDLTVVSVRASPSEVYHGENLNIEFTEKNQGNANSGLFKTRIYLAGTEYGRDYPIGETESHSLRAGETKTYRFSLPIPSTIPPGEYYVTVFIDYLNQVEESNENNNIGSTTPNKVRIKARQFFADHKSFEVWFPGLQLPPHSVYFKLDYKNDLANDVIIVFYIKDANGNIISATAWHRLFGYSIAKASSSGTVRAQWIARAGTFYFSWKAYLTSDKNLANPIDGSTPAEEKSITLVPVEGMAPLFHSLLNFKDKVKRTFTIQGFLPTQVYRYSVDSKNANSLIINYLEDFPYILAPIYPTKLNPLRYLYVFIPNTIPIRSYSVEGKTELVSIYRTSGEYKGTWYIFKLTADAKPAWFEWEGTIKFNIENPVFTSSIILRLSTLKETISNNILEEATHKLYELIASKLAGGAWFSPTDLGTFLVSLGFDILSSNQMIILDTGIANKQCHDTCSQLGKSNYSRYKR